MKKTFFFTFGVLFSIWTSNAKALSLPEIKPGAEYKLEGDVQGVAEGLGLYMGIASVYYTFKIGDVLMDGSYNLTKEFWFHNDYYFRDPDKFEHSEIVVEANQRVTLEQLLLGDNCSKYHGVLVNTNIDKETITACKVDVIYQGTKTSFYYAGSSIPIIISQGIERTVNPYYRAVPTR